MCRKFQDLLCELGRGVQPDLNELIMLDVLLGLSGDRCAKDIDAYLEYFLVDY